ncbi:MAG: hypothetical protein E6R03_00345 [Hyphomicrobiaceae bacterium]|nr:MAG: hypothetical protein E6R03_00345 [Hyphomicrobiaceae bacterium]
MFHPLRRLLFALFTTLFLPFIAKSAPTPPAAKAAAPAGVESKRPVVGPPPVADAFGGKAVSGKPPFGTPQEEVFTAAKWVKSLLEAKDGNPRVGKLVVGPEGVKDLLKHIRFLSVYHLPPTEREDYTKGLPFVANSLNRDLPIAPLFRVSESLYAVDYRDFGWTSTAVRNVFAKDLYFKDQWVTLTNLNFLRYYVDANPILRADQFVELSMAPPHYYELLDLPKTQKELFELLGVDVVRNEKILRERSAAITQDLTVTLNNRRLTRYDAVTKTWVSFDVDNGKDPSDVLVQLGRPNDGKHELQIAGQEIIFELGNGLHGYYLNNAVGDRADSVPTTIARDATHFRRVDVIPGYSCIACHNGLQPFRCGLNTLLSGNFVQLRQYDKQVQIELSAVYNESSLQRLFKQDQESYTESLKLINNLPPEENSLAFARMYRNRVDRRVTIEFAAAEVGLSSERFLQAITPAVHPEALRLLRPGNDLARDTWDNIFFHAMSLRPATPEDGANAIQWEQPKDWQPGQLLANPPKGEGASTGVDASGFSSTVFVVPKTLTDGRVVTQDVSITGPAPFVITRFAEKTPIQITVDSEQPQKVHTVSISFTYRQGTEVPTKFDLGTASVWFEVPVERR